MQVASMGSSKPQICGLRHVKLSASGLLCLRFTIQGLDSSKNSNSNSNSKSGQASRAGLFEGHRRY